MSTPSSAFVHIAVAAVDTQNYSATTEDKVVRVRATWKLAATSARSGVGPSYVVGLVYGDDVDVAAVRIAGAVGGVGLGRHQRQWILDDTQ